MTPILPKPPCTLEEIKPEWVALVRDIIVKEGRAIRGLPEHPTIEVKSLTTNVWLLLMLPNSGTQFASLDDRNLILSQLEGRSAILNNG